MPHVTKIVSEAPGRISVIMSDQVKHVVQLGDEYRDNDPRLDGQRVVRITAVGRAFVTVELVARPEWSRAKLGRKTEIALNRLLSTANQQRGYTKVSR